MSKQDHAKGGDDPNLKNLFSNKSRQAQTEWSSHSTTDSLNSNWTPLADHPRYQAHDEFLGSLVPSWRKYAQFEKGTQSSSAPKDFTSHHAGSCHGCHRVPAYLSDPFLEPPSPPVQRSAWEKWKAASPGSSLASEITLASRDPQFWSRSILEVRGRDANIFNSSGVSPNMHAPIDSLRPMAGPAATSSPFLCTDKYKYSSSYGHSAFGHQTLFAQDHLRPCQASIANQGIPSSSFSLSMSQANQVDGRHYLHHEAVPTFALMLQNEAQKFGNYLSCDRFIGTPPGFDSQNFSKGNNKEDKNNNLFMALQPQDIIWKEEDSENSSSFWNHPYPTNTFTNTTSNNNSYQSKSLKMSDHSSGYGESLDSHQSYASSEILTFESRMKIQSLVLQELESILKKFTERSSQIWQYPSSESRSQNCPISRQDQLPKQLSDLKRNERKSTATITSLAVNALWVFRYSFWSPNSQVSGFLGTNSFEATFNPYFRLIVFVVTDNVPIISTKTIDSYQVFEVTNLPVINGKSPFSGLASVKSPPHLQKFIIAICDTTWNRKWLPACIELKASITKIDTKLLAHFSPLELAVLGLDFIWPLPGLVQLPFWSRQLNPLRQF